MGKPCISLVGGTGHLGKGLAIRLAAAGYPVLIGSRIPKKARRAALDVEQVLSKHGIRVSIGYGENREVVKKGDIVILTVPYEALDTILPVVRDSIKEGAVLVSPVVPMRIVRGKAQRISISEGSVALRIQKEVPEAKVVAAFHTVSYRLLLEYPAPIEGDVLIFGDDDKATAQVAELVSTIPKLRPIPGGGLKEAYIVEHIVPLMINIAHRMGKRDIGIKFVWRGDC